MTEKLLTEKLTAAGPAGFVAAKRPYWIWYHRKDDPGAADDGHVYEETSYRLEILVAADRLGEAKELFVRIGRQLGQRAIYWEVREGGEIIDLE